jgi:protein phosphatase
MSDDARAEVPKWFAMGPLPSPLDSPPPSVEVEVKAGARSRSGRVSSVNRDHYLVLRLGRSQETLLTSLPAGAVPQRFHESGYGLVVANGVGGAGEAASRLAISTLVHLAVYFGRWHLRIDEVIAEEVMDRAERFFRSIDATLLRATRDGARDLRSTLTAVFTAGTELFFAHVGHSRAYLFRDNELMQLTRDQFLDRSRPGSAAVTHISDRTTRPRRVVTERLGEPGPGAPRIDIERCGLLNGDVILVCTNGLTDVVDDTHIADALRSERSPDDQCQALMDLVEGAGGADDATAVVAHYHLRG